MTLQRPARERGFTLAEVLVALVVLGLLLLSLSQGMRAGLMALGVQAQMTARQTDIEAFDRLLRRLVSRADHGAPEIGPPYFIGGAHDVAFTTLLPDAGEAAAQLVDVALGVDARHRLVFRWSPRFVHPIGPPIAPREIGVLPAVDHIDVAYWDAAARPPAWVAPWTRAEVPDLIRLHVVFTDRRHGTWPEMIVATLGR